jgi:hypothetical protein
MRYATSADLDFARTRGARERNAKIITHAGKRYMAAIWELADNGGHVFVVVAPDASAVLTEAEARALGVLWDKKRIRISLLRKFLAGLLGYTRNRAKEARRA